MSLVGSVRNVGEIGLTLLSRLGVLSFAERILSAVAMLTLAVGTTVLGWQGYVWATTGRWPEVQIASALPYLGIDPSAVYEPQSWKGFASVAAWLLNLPLASLALVLPLILLVFAAGVAFYYRFVFDPMRDFRDDIEICKARAEAGQPADQNNLGYVFERGVLGMPQDYVQAHMWYNIAAATHLRGELRDGSARNRDRVARRMSAQQVAEAQALARELLKHRFATHAQSSVA